MTFIGLYRWAIVSVAVFYCIDGAFATCTGASSPAALQSFVSDPGAWLDANGKASDLGAQVGALAAAAVNGKDPAFGKALSAALGKASADQGSSIGTALGGLGTSCSDPKDPADAADKQYISQNIAPNMLANANANLAYGIASGPQTAATGTGGGGTGGGGAGVGGQTGTPGTSGGSGGGGGVTPTTGGIPTQGFTTPNISAGSATPGGTTTTQSFIIINNAIQ